MTLAACVLTFGYSRRATILQGVSAEFLPGLVTAVVGPNGVGKSTLLRLLAGVATPWSGAVTLDGAPITMIPPHRRAARLALVAQRPTVAGPFTVEEVVRLGRHALPARDAAVSCALDRLELAPLRDRVVMRLSVGQRQRVAVARALAQIDARDTAPGALAHAAILLDEPAAALDPRHAAAVFGLLRDLAGAGARVVIVLHDLTSALAYADRAVVLAASQVAAAGPVRETLTPERLEGVFGVGFEVVGVPPRAALLPSARDSGNVPGPFRLG